jgi:cyclopropane-fatty-acyl-phospholipid synthase
MSSNPLAPSGQHSTPRVSPAPAAARAALRLLARIERGSLTVEWPDGTRHRFGQAASPHASMRWHNWAVCQAALQSGDIGFAETYIAGDWSTPDLTGLIEQMIANRDAIEDAVYGSWLGRLVYRLRHWRRRNSKPNSRKNIHAHYDLGNAFYQLWLDDTMNYSSAYFERADQPMPEAQQAKVRRALRMARVRPGDRVLEIGCGWGALAEMATTEMGACVTGVTLSSEQLAYAQARMQGLHVPQPNAANAANDPGPWADLRLQDYRDIPDGPFDAICSIEMIEAVGQSYWPTYFATVAQKLKPGGYACIQSIVIQDQRFERYIQGTDFIQQYIFPGGCLPSPRVFREAAKKAGLMVQDAFHFGQDYAQTLRLWREGFMRQQAEVLRLGFDQRFLRIWEFYLAYCEAAFRQGSTDVVQFTLHKPG